MVGSSAEVFSRLQRAGEGDETARERRKGREKLGCSRQHEEERWKRSLVLTFSTISQSSPNLIAMTAAAVFSALRRSETNLPCGPGLTNAANFPPLHAKS